MTMMINISSATTAFLEERFGTDYDPQRGYTSEQAAEARRRYRTVEGSSNNSNNDDDDDDDEQYNVVRAPLNCPPWICCLLPCLTKIPSMKAFKAITPEDAEVLRQQAPRGRRNTDTANSNDLTSQWIRYDATSLVCGDVIRLEEGDIVPADCLVVQVLEANHQPYEDDNDNNDVERQSQQGDNKRQHRRRPSLLVDSRAVTGEDKPRSISATLCLDDGETNDDSSSSDKKNSNEKRLDSNLENNNKKHNFQQRQLHWGATVVQGRCIAIVTAIGSHTLVSRLIRQRKFPAQENVLAFMEQDDNNNNEHHHLGHDEDAEAGISLLARKNNPSVV